MKVTILGEELDIRFNMAVEIAYEEITGEGFTIESLGKMKNMLALGMAAIISAKEDTAITIERLMKEANGKEIGTLNNAVVTAMTEWLQIPKVVADAEAREEQTDVNEKQPKN